MFLASSALDIWKTQQQQYAHTCSVVDFVVCILVSTSKSGIIIWRWKICTAVTTELVFVSYLSEIQESARTMPTGRKNKNTHTSHVFSNSVFWLKFRIIWRRKICIWNVLSNRLTERASFSQQVPPLLAICTDIYLHIYSSSVSPARKQQQQ